MTDDAARQLLEQRREDLLQRRAALEMEDGDGQRLELSELSFNDQHPADVGTETFEREKDLSILDGIDTELEEVERALLRIGDGGYGLCQACGKRIPVDRLKALPAVRYCVDDQVRMERHARADV